MSDVSRILTIAIVGPCAAGKTSLARALQERGLAARQITQEHSYVPAMWQLLTKPDVLIYLDASYEVCTRRKNINWLPKEYDAQIHRLRHARKHCHVYVKTDNLTIQEVLDQVLEALPDYLDQV
jgi:deoxyadenosine/deoxycytidine kinase